jgi:hypothetical protein
MNRLAPLIVRRSGRFAYAASAIELRPAFERSCEAPATSEEVRLFATTFLAGLVFFGTYLA